MVESRGPQGGFNPPISWRELERRLSDSGPVPDPRTDPRTGSNATSRPEGADGGDSPAWSHHRPAYQAPAVLRRPAGPRTLYAELHCHSSFSFLDGASDPEALAEEATRLGLDALAVTDHDSFSGVVRFSQAARELGLPTVFGAELTLGRTQLQAGVADPDETHLVVLARNPRGYALLARAISEAQLRGEKGLPRAQLDHLVALGGTAAPAADRDHWVVLTGCRKGAVPAAMVNHGPSAAAAELARLTEGFGAANVAVELWDHGHPVDSARNDALAELSVRAGLDVVVTNNVHYATPAQRPLANALAAVRARRSLDEIDGWLPAGAGAALRSGAEQARRFARYPGVVERTAELGRSCAFDLQLVAPELPLFDCPPGHDEMSWLRVLVARGAERRYGPPTHERVPGAYAQLHHELALIDQLNFPGYFLVVWDLVEFCRRNDIFCQGRGSAANSAVCYALGITNADAVALGLLFERFLSPERDGPPDIDIDIESDRREEVIQYVYERHGREYAAQVANVITYRARSAVRDMAKALGYATGQQDAFAKAVDRWSSLATEPEGIPAPVVALAAQAEHLPRHLGIHSGGMVICDRPVVEVCPVEWGRMPGRTVLQWDKDDCAAAGLVKFDLLGLGMLSALHYTVDLVAEHCGHHIDLALLPQEDEVYDMLCRADSVGVFQVESRAQMATLPRLKPRRFYDLVVEVALIRPGPIQGGSVHPYIRRRNGTEPVTYLHPLLEKSLAKTLGVPLFQEQLMQMAIDVAGFSAAEADELRQAMGSKRSIERMERLQSRLFAGMAERGVTDDVAVAIYDKLAAFANYGFPESHSVSFSYLVYASSWLKLHYPAAFCAGLLNAQPMGFYSPHSLVQDARRHGVVVRSPDLNASGAAAVLEPAASTGAGGVATSAAARGDERSNGDANADAGADVNADVDVDPHDQSWIHGPPGIRDTHVAVRLGLGSVRHLGPEVAEAIEAARVADGPYASMEDLRRRVPQLTLPQLEALATAGAFGTLTDREGRRLDRRRALWGSGAVAQTSVNRLPGIVTGAEAPRLPGMTDHEEAVADLWATGVAPDGHPTRFLRAQLDDAGVVVATGLVAVEPGSKVLVGGVVTHRQRPATAGGTTFINLEDETGLINVVCSKGCWLRHRHVARGASALLVRGRLERSEGVTNVIAERLLSLPVGATVASRDFR